MFKRLALAVLALTLIWQTVSGTVILAVESGGDSAYSGVEAEYFDDGEYEIEVGFEDSSYGIDEKEQSQELDADGDFDEDLVLYDERIEADALNSSIPTVTLRISTAEQLAAIPSGPMSHDMTFVLENDIHLTHEWSPIIDFRGTFDGQGHTIHNLFVLESSRREDVGLFASTEGAVIRNVMVRIGTQGIMHMEQHLLEI